MKSTVQSTRVGARFHVRGDRFLRRCNSSLAVTCLTPFIATVGYAADTSDSGALEEVVITAQHRTESLQDVPVAVTAFSQADLEKFGFADPTAVAAQTPSLEIKGTQGQSKPNVFLRGVGNNDFKATASNAVGFYNDQVYQGLPSAQLFQMFDLERVEVLRGPQGTLYGRNTTGGAINFISRQPDGTTNGDFGAGVLASSICPERFSFH